jgi:hypothetical protein
MKEALVSVQNVSVSFGKKLVLNDVSLEVCEDEVTVLLGPNGSGKTTLVNCIQGLVKPDKGSVQVLGENPCKGTAWKDEFGGMLQDSKLDSDLTVKEMLTKFASYYSHPLGLDSVLEIAGLSEQSAAKTFKLSGGQKKRLDFALALIGDPRVLVLDEPTASLDHQSRKRMWQAIQKVSHAGTAVLLITHDMQEVQELYDHLAILDGGKIILNRSNKDIEAWSNSMRVEREDSILKPASQDPSDSSRDVPRVEDIYDHIIRGGTIEL